MTTTFEEEIQAFGTRLAAVVQKHWPLIVAGSAFIVILVRMLLKTIDANEGHLIYALDDAYIHMSIARNFIQHGTWGVTQYAFTSSTSSPLWTLLVALTYGVFGVNEVSPFILNVLSSLALLAVVYFALRRHTLPGLFNLSVLMVIVVAVPLNPYIFAGMEHLLHASLSITFLYVAALVLNRDERPPLRSQKTLGLWLLGMLLASVRYEGLFLVAVICALFLLRRRPVYAITLGAVSALPVVIYGLISIAHGWPFLPVTLLLKARDAVSLLDSLNSPGALIQSVVGIYETLRGLPLFMTGLVVAAALAILNGIRTRRVWHVTTIIPLAFILTALLHVRFVQAEGVFQRYHMYLLAMMIFAVSIGVAHYLRLEWRAWPVYVVFGAVMLYGGYQLADRYFTIRQTQPMLWATNNIYHQQYQMGRFLRATYEGQTVVLNDIGAANFLADLKIVDIWGLGTLEIAQARMADTYTLDTMLDIIEAHDATIAIVYQHWLLELVGRVPPDWVSVGRWGAPHPVSLGGEVVTFYALDSNETEPLIRNLQQFQGKLPQIIEQEGRYIDQRR